MQYSIPAIPTTYKGNDFKSRLEARWAAFMELLSWSYEYEPTEFCGWYPDFAIETVHRPVFVEVKPLDGDGRDRETMRRMVGAAGKEILLLLGCTPVGGILGWVYLPGKCWRQAKLGRWSDHVGFNDGTDKNQFRSLITGKKNERAFTNYSDDFETPAAWREAWKLLCKHMH